MTLVRALSGLRLGILAGTIIAVGIALTPASVVRAQETSALDPTPAERAAIGRQTEIAAGLYVAGGLLFVGGLVGVPVGIIGVFSGSSSGDYFAGFVAGAVALGLGIIGLVVALSLHVNAEHRRGRLPPGPSIAPGPGDVGVALSFVLDG